LRLAPFGAINVHGSLLPRWRGAAPIQWAIASGDRETGITIMQMDEGLDTGDILLQRALDIGADDTSEWLSPRLSELGGEALVAALDALARGALVPVRQDPAQATLARILEKEDGRVDWTRPAGEIAARLRGFTPWPGAFTTLGGKLLKVHRARVDGASSLAPGAALATPAGLLVGCGDGAALLLEEVQLEGKKRVPAAEFLRGAPLAAGTVLGR
jgi:methionyl-tRNA formyltransferase